MWFASRGGMSRVSQSASADSALAPEPPAASRLASESRGLLSKLGPGLITGASDDDPSGIATYSQAGAQFGYSLLWVTLFTIPLMTAIQEVCARIGRITGRGLAGNIRQYYSRWLLYPIVGLMVAATVINLGADIGAMGDACRLVFGGPAAAYSVALAIVSLVLQVFYSYRAYSRYMKWLTLVLLCYPLTAFCVRIPWSEAFLATLVPTIHFGSAYFATLIAVLGTTISPYLFVWQASLETEEIRCAPEELPLKYEPAQARAQFSRIRWDTIVGMTLSNVIAFFIILTAAATLHAAKITDIESSTQAAKALEPLAGRFAFVLFTLGIVGTGMLAVPVLAGSAAYAVGEALKWPTGLDRKLDRARGFYGIMILATLIGLALNFTSVDPIKALFWAAVINGVVAAPLMAVAMLMVANPRIVGRFALISRPMRYLGWLATLVMALAVVGLFATWGG